MISNVTLLQKSLMYNDSNDANSCTYDNQSTTGSVYSQPFMYFTGDHIQQLSGSLNSIVVRLTIYTELSKCSILYLPPRRFYCI